ncbi:hypothetical protein B2A_14540, partial [mine drainage metagenome]
HKFQIQRISVTAYRQLRRLPVFVSTGLVSSSGTARLRLHPGARLRTLPSAEVTASIFPTLDVHPLLGSWMNLMDDKPGGPRQVVLSKALWQSAYDGNPHVIGQTLIIRGKAYTIAG